MKKLYSQRMKIIWECQGKKRVCLIAVVYSNTAHCTVSHVATTGGLKKQEIIKYYIHSFAHSLSLGRLGGCYYLGWRADLTLKSYNDMKRAAPETQRTTNNNIKKKKKRSKTKKKKSNTKTYCSARIRRLFRSPPRVH